MKLKFRLAAIDALNAISGDLEHTEYEAQFTQAASHRSHNRGSNPKVWKWKGEDGESHSVAHGGFPPRGRGRRLPRWLRVKFRAEES